MNILLVSGGMDSFIAFHKYTSKNIPVKPVYIDYKGKYCKKEIEVCSELYPNMQIIKGALDLSKYEDPNDPNAFIRNRNLLFATIASTEFPLASTIIMAGLKDDNVGDKSKHAFKFMSDVLSEINGRFISVQSPFWECTKVEIIQAYVYYGGDVAELLKTSSCYDSTKKWCGECPSCFRRFAALNSAGIVDPKMPTFNNKNLVADYLNRINTYDKKRQESIKLAAYKIYGRYY